MRLGRYESALKGVIRDVKFAAWRSLGTQVGRLMGERLFDAIQAELRTGALAESLLADADGHAREIEIIPVPTSRWHRMQRGIDHTLVLSRGVVSELRRRGLAARVRTALAREHRPAQPLVRASERERNVAGSMRVSRSLYQRVRGTVQSFAFREGVRDARHQPPAVTIASAPRLRVVVDDVRTTGATLKAACRALRPGHGLRGRGGSSSEGLGTMDAVWVLTAAVAERIEPHAGEWEEGDTP